MTESLVITRVAAVPALSTAEPGSLAAGKALPAHDRARWAASAASGGVVG